MIAETFATAATELRSTTSYKPVNMATLNKENLGKPCATRGCRESYTVTASVKATHASKRVFPTVLRNQARLFNS